MTNTDEDEEGKRQENAACILCMEAYETQQPVCLRVLTK